MRYSRSPGGAERVGDEPLGGQPGAAEVAAGQPGAAEVQLAGDPRRHRPQRRVEHVDARVPGIGRPIGTAPLGPGRPRRSPSVELTVASVGP